MEPVQETSSWRKNLIDSGSPLPNEGERLGVRGRAHHWMSSQVFRDPYRSRLRELESS